MVTAAILAAAAFAAGVTGAWSPCGFSMVETLAGAAGREGGAGRRLVRAGCATFAVGAVLGGVLTFGALALLGAALGSGGTGALAVAAALALAAALADALGVRVAPQIRRQVPEPWRRTLPLPLAAALYGVLLGLGFTTFVLAFAVWALAGIAVAVGAPATGAAIGVAFGLGRALPVVAMAPRHETLGARLATRMAEEPRLLRRLRLADAALLAAAALALALGPAAASADAAPRASGGAAPAAGAAESAAAAARTTEARRAAARASRAQPAGQRLARVAVPGWSPSAADGALAWQVDRERVRVRDAGHGTVELATRRAALGGPHLAILDRDLVDVSDRATGAHVATLATPAADELAVSERWIVWRVPAAGDDDGDVLQATALPPPGVPAPPAEPVTIARVGGLATIGRPALDGDRVAFAIATPRGSRIVVRDLAAGTRRVALAARRIQLGDPALHGDRLLFTEARVCDQRLLLAALDEDGRAGRSRTLVRLGRLAWRDGGREPGRTRQGSLPTSCPRGAPPRAKRMLSTTALDGSAAYVTLLRPDGAARPFLARVRL